MIGEATPQTTSATTSAGVGLVPSRQQYLDLKARHPRAILLYRLGDFYETFDEDARTVARDARITLTSRGFGRNGRVPMAGIPHHALNHYLARLLAAGHTIAIAEQVSEAGAGLVERAVTRVLTPGTVAEPGLLTAGESRYLAAVRPLGERVGLAWVDVSTGEFTVAEFAGPEALAHLHEELARLGPAECLTPDDDPPLGRLPGHQTRLERWHFDPGRAAAALHEHLGVQTLAPFGCADLPAAVGAAGAILAYVTRTNAGLRRLLTGLRTLPLGRQVGLDAATRRNLELTRGLRSGGSRASLLHVLDQTRTAMGARTLRRLIGQPLNDLAELGARQAVVAALVAAAPTRARLAATLPEIGDLERLIGRVAQGLGAPRDFANLAAALRGVPRVVAALQADERAELAAVAARLDPCADVLATVEAAIRDDPAHGPVFQPGFWPPLDETIAGARQTRAWLAGLERSERERTGIRSLKVGYNKVFGYYIEVTRSNLALVPPEYVRKQTVANGERYLTTTLKEAEATILAADEAIAGHERAALAALSARVAASTARLQATAGHLAHLDALLALAESAARGGWSRPVLDESETLTIVGGRHPVVEANLEGDAFMPNDCALGQGEGPRLLLVTGPNMGGKSTYLRQVALIVLLAQIGSFVPAASARIGLVDRIFSRVGAQDDIARGASTFMVEMTETAFILHHATRRSLVILDEVGRGTSTDDGLAIAQAVMEDLHERAQARTLFATHFLELASLAATLPRLANVHVAAMEVDDRLIFLHTVRPGPADRSYGLHVARLAGIPRATAERAAALLAEGGHRRRTAAPAAPAPEPAPPPTAAEGGQLTLRGFAPGPAPATRLAHALRDLDVAALTPREAIDWLFDQQARLGGGGEP